MAKTLPWLNLSCPSLFTKSGLFPKNKIVCVNDSDVVYSDRVQQHLSSLRLLLRHFTVTGVTYKHRPSVVRNVAQHRSVVALPTFRHNISTPYSRVKLSNEEITQGQKHEISPIRTLFKNYIILLKHYSSLGSYFM
jgi:hypothetical protein